MADFHHKVRYNIRLAERKGVEVRVGTREDVAVFHRMIVETGIRDNFVVRSREYYEKVFDCLSPDHLRVLSQAMRVSPSQVPSPSCTAINAGICTEPA